MKKILICLLISLFFTVNASAMMVGQGGLGVSVSGECTEFYAPSLTGDAVYDLGKLNGEEYTGFIYVTGGAQEDVCKVDLKIQGVNGDLADHDYFLKIWTIDGSNVLQVSQGTSSGLDGNLMSAGTWTSANAGYFEFSSSVSLSATTSYAFTFFVDQDGNQDDDPEIDGTNYPAVHYDNENDEDATMLGRFIWKDSDKSVQKSDAEDDILIKIFTD